MATDLQKTTWVKVSAQEKCVACGSSSWCTRAADGSAAKCMRGGEGEPKLDRRGNAYWVHVLTDKLPPVIARPKKPKRPIDFGKYAKACSFSKMSWVAREEMASRLGISVVAIEKLGVGYCESHKYTTWPERDPNGTVVGITRRYENGEKKTAFDSSHGLYFEDDWWDHDGPVFVPEGGTDTSCLIGLDLSAIGRFSNTGGCTLIAEMLVNIRRPVIVLGEMDRKSHKCQNCSGCSLCWPGKFGAILTAQTIKQRIQEPVYWTLLPHKDVRKWLRNHPTPTRECFLEDATRSMIQV